MQTNYNNLGGYQILKPINNKEDNKKMLNIYQQNLFQGEDDSTRDKMIKNANFDLRMYLDYIDVCIKLVNEKAIKVAVKKIEIIKLFEEKNGNKVFIKEIEKKELKKEDEKYLNDSEVRYYLDDEKISDKDEKIIAHELFENGCWTVYREKPKVKKEENKDLEIKIIDKNIEEVYLILDLDDKESVSYFYLKPETYQLEQQKKAIQRLINQPTKYNEPIIRLFAKPDKTSIFFVENINYSENVKQWYILTDETRDGTKEQREFVIKALRSNDFALLEGPPGSGKTTTIIELIMQFVERGKRILLCSSTHVAVDNVIDRILNDFKTQCEGKVVPIRICRNVKEIRKKSVEPYLLKSFVNKMKDDIKSNLSNNLTTASKKLLYDCIETKDDTFENIILESANLVAGTMIGILQHPAIKKGNNNTMFDVMIVDESSKVTFNDFLVPAMYAKKWIFSGDVNQLSPYIDDDFVSENISKIIPEQEKQKVLTETFEVQKHLIRNDKDNAVRVLVANIDEKYFNEEIKKTFANKQVTFVSENFEKSAINILKLNASDLIICQNSQKAKKMVADNLFVKSVVFENEILNLSFTNRQNYFYKDNKYPKYFFKTEQNWNEMVSSRLGQLYEYRFDAKLGKNLKQELDMLVPLAFRNEVDNIRKLSMPSILEILQIGIGETISNNGYKIEKFIYEGFKNYEQIKNLKFQSLTYQHRMNDDIAEIPRKYFYEGKNLKSANTVTQRTNYLKNYKPTEKSVIWVCNNDKSYEKAHKNFNPTEVDDIERELREFHIFSNNKPKIVKGQSEKYEIAILTFYRQQENELRKMLRNFCNQGKHKHFTKDNLDITLCTVDKFQGDEADLVLLSFTKNTPFAFYNVPNRLNVSLTRARYKLVLFGNKAWFENNAKSDALKNLAKDFDYRIKENK